MTEAVAEFEIHRSAYLDPTGTLLQELPPDAPDRDELEALYRWMVLTRTFDAKAVALQRTGLLGTYASSLGQEALSVGIGRAMKAEDVLLPAFRDHGTLLYRGVTMTELLLFWGGDERGSNYAGPRDDFPISITVGGHAPHATGVALALELRGEPRVAVCIVGDGATSKGDFYEAMNIAGTWHLPVVFVVANNQWAISMPRAEQTAAGTLAQKAIAAGFEGTQVDGNDLVAVCHGVGAAVSAAREQNGPALVECLTYRLADHTTSDQASRYRDDAEVSQWWQRDPIARLRLYLTKNHGWDRQREQALLASCRDSVEAAAEAYQATPPQAPESMFDYLYAELPADLAAQRDAMSSAVDSRGEDAAGG